MCRWFGGPRHLRTVIRGSSCQIQYFEAETKLSFKPNFRLLIKLEVISLVSSDVLNDHPEAPELSPKRHFFP